MRAPVSIVLIAAALSLPASWLSACGSGVEGSANGGGGAGDATDPDGADGVADGDELPDGAGGNDTTPTPDGAPDGETVDNNPTDPVLVEIVSPVNGETVRGPIVVRMEPMGVTEREVDFVNLRVNGLTVYQDLKLPTEIVLDTRQHAAGPLTLEAVAEDGFDKGSHRIRVQPDNPPITFLEVTPREQLIKNGDVLSIEVLVDGPAELKLNAEIGAIDSAWEPGMETAYPLGAGRFAITYIMSQDNNRRDGTYTIPITATIAGWEVSYTQLQVTLRNGSTAPIFVPGGIFVDQAIPAPGTGEGAPAPALEASNSVILTGGSTRVTVDFSNHPTREQIIGIIVGLEGAVGHYQVPVTEEDGDIIEVPLRLRAFADWETPPNSLPLRVGLRDARGQVTAYAAHLLNVTKVGSGDIQVSLTWDTPTDVDLHVIDPFGCELYYGNESDIGFGFGDECKGFGGELDLDSNAGCGIDFGYQDVGGIRNENVFWPPGAAPEGIYTVKVDYWSNCSVAENTNFVVTINYCGKTEVYEDFFTASQADGGGAGSGRFIARFDNRLCSRTATGRVRYQDRTFDRTGFGAHQWHILEGAVVELRRLQTNEVIGSGVTDRNGYYSIPFPADIPGFVVAVRAQSDPAEGLRDIKVYDHPKFKRLYEVTSAPIIITPVQETVIQDIDISVEQKAGAFNVFDVLREGYDLVRLANGEELGELRAFWMTGADTTDTIYCSPFLYDNGVCTELQSVSVQGKDTDRDEFDDMVILKEFFKFALSKLARDSHPGGNVDGRRDDPRKSWTEGVAEFFASDTLSSRYFVNSRPLGVYVVDDLEGMPSPFAIGIKSAKLSPYMVSAFLWDLADSNNEAWDPVDRMRNAIYDVLFSYLPSDAYVDRGPEGVDLGDFVDGWLCRGWGLEDEVRALLVDHYGFDHAFDGPRDCAQ